MFAIRNNLLTGSKIFLRTLTEDDASPDYAVWLNDAEVNRYLETRSVTIDGLKTFIREKNANPHALLLGIFWKENGLHIGNIKLEPIDLQRRSAVLGILIGEKAYWGKGVATEAIELVTHHAFSALRLKEMTLGVIAEHTAAIRAYEKCGFVIAHREKNAINHDGVLFDRIVMISRAPAGLAQESDA